MVNGQYDRGLEILKHAVVQAADIPEIHYHLAVAYARTGSIDKAKMILNKAIQADSKLKNLPYTNEILQGN